MARHETIPDDQLQTEFEIFYAEYTRKKSPRTAFKAFHAARRRGVSFGDLMDGLARAKQTWEREKRLPKFIPYPATWLNADGYKDGEPSKERPSLDRALGV